MALGLPFAAAEGLLRGVTVRGVGVAVSLCQAADKLSQQIIAELVVLMGYLAWVTDLGLLGDDFPAVLCVLVGHDLRKTADQHVLFPAVLIVEVFLNLRTLTGERTVFIVAFLIMDVLCPFCQGTDQISTIIIAHFIVRVKDKIHVCIRVTGQYQFIDGTL
jgi:hypothetical protein